MFTFGLCGFSTLVVELLGGVAIVAIVPSRTDADDVVVDVTSYSALDVVEIK